MAQCSGVQASNAVNAPILSDLSVGGSFNCGLKADDGTAICWGAGWGADDCVPEPDQPFLHTNVRS